MTVPPCIADPVFEDEPLKGLTTEAAAYRLWFRLEKQGRWKEMQDFLPWKFSELILPTYCDPWLWSMEDQRSQSLWILELHQNEKQIFKHFLKISSKSIYNWSILLTEKQGPSHNLGGSNHILQVTVDHTPNTVVWPLIPSPITSALT